MSPALYTQFRQALPSKGQEQNSKGSLHDHLQHNPLEGDRRENATFSNPQEGNTTKGHTPFAPGDCCQCSQTTFLILEVHLFLLHQTFLWERTSLTSAILLSQDDSLWVSHFLHVLQVRPWLLFALDYLLKNICIANKPSPGQRAICLHHWWIECFLLEQMGRQDYCLHIQSLCSEFLLNYNPLSVLVSPGSVILGIKEMMQQNVGAGAISFAMSDNMAFASKSPWNLHSLSCLLTTRMKSQTLSRCQHSLMLD